MIRRLPPPPPPFPRPPLLLLAPLKRMLLLVMVEAAPRPPPRGPRRSCCCCCRSTCATFFFLEYRRMTLIKSRRKRRVNRCASSNPPKSKTSCASSARGERLRIAVTSSDPVVLGIVFDRFSMLPRSVVAAALESVVEAMPFAWVALVTMVASCSFAADRRLLLIVIMYRRKRNKYWPPPSFSSSLLSYALLPALCVDDLEFDLDNGVGGGIEPRSRLARGERGVSESWLEASLRVKRPPMSDAPWPSSCSSPGSTSSLKSSALVLCSEYCWMKDWIKCSMFCAPPVSSSPPNTFFKASKTWSRLRICDKWDSKMVGSIGMFSTCFNNVHNGGNSSPTSSAISLFVSINFTYLRITIFVK